MAGMNHHTLSLFVLLCGLTPACAESPAAAEPQETPDPEVSVPVELQAALERMEAASRRLSSKHTDPQTQMLQQEAAKRLKRAVDALERQLQSQGPSQPQPPNASQTENEMPDEDGQSTGTPRPDDDGASRKNADDSTERSGDAEAQLVEAARRRVLLQGVWGHLRPELQREILDLGDERPLPKYDELVKRYFQSLATGPERQQ